MTADINMDNLTIKIKNYYCLCTVAVSLKNKMFSTPCTDWNWSLISYRIFRFVIYCYTFLSFCPVLAFCLQPTKHGRVERILRSLWTVSSIVFGRIQLHLPVNIKERISVDGTLFCSVQILYGTGSTAFDMKVWSYVLVRDDKRIFSASMNWDFTKATDFSTPAVSAIKFCFSRAWFGKINPLNTKRRLLYLKIQFVPRSKNFSSQL